MYLYSKSWGVDFEYAKSKGIKVIHALSLPGKFCPRSSAQFIAETISEKIRKGV